MGRQYSVDMTYMVSATEEIRHSGSLISRFLRTEFPVLDDLGADFQAQLKDAETLMPKDPNPDYPWSLVGTAIDYRLRFLFEILPVTRLQAFRSAQWSFIADTGSALDERVPFTYGPEGRMSVSMPRVSAELFIALRDFLRRVRPARRSLSHNDKAWLCRYCAALALVDTKVTQKLRTGTHPLQTLPSGSTLDDLFALIPKQAVVDIYTLSRRFQDTAARTWMASSVTFDPHVWVGNIGASPDVMVGDCLLDLKTTLRPRLERMWLDQLLLYALVVSDRHRVQHLGFHLVRQARTVSWPMEDFVERAAGRSKVDIEQLSLQFFSVAARSSHLPPQDRWEAST